MRKNEIGWKIGIFKKKIHFSWNFKNPPKMVKKSAIFSKKNKTLFCFKITSVCRKLISKLVSRSSQSTLCVYEAWNAPKSNPTLLARLKAQNLIFSAKISRLFDFQISKLARLKTVTKNKALTCAMRAYDPKQTSPMISSHSHEFRALNAPFFFKDWNFFFKGCELLNTPKVSDSILARLKLYDRIEWVQGFPTVTLKLIYDN